MQTNIQAAAEGVLIFLESIPMSDKTVKYYRSCYRIINRFCLCNGIDGFSDSDAEAFSKFQMERHEKGEITLVYALTLRKAAAMLADMMSGKKLKWERRNYNQKRMCDSYENILLEFEASVTQFLSHGSVKLLLLMVRQFLFYLECGGLRDLSKLTNENVRKYIVDASPRHKGNMINLTWPTKKFLLFLDNRGIVAINAAALLANPAPRQKKVLPCFTTEESESMLDVPDTDTPIGKRDFAIMRLAHGTGLRGEDIVNLRLADINWRTNEISAVQSKTGTYITLPLMPDVGNAVADYILNARPKADSPYVFLRHKRPHSWLGNGPIGAAIMKRYQSKAGIVREARDGKTFHAFRRTVGTRLIKAGVPLPSAAQILGHREIESTKRYIALNEDALRVCCMDISVYATRKAGLV